MPRRLRYTPEALDDLDEVLRWLTQSGSGSAARRRLKAIRAAINRLRDRPYLYAVGDYHGVRELPCDGGHRVFYEVMNDTGINTTAGDVRVLRIYGPGQSREDP